MRKAFRRLGGSVRVVVLDNCVKEYSHRTSTEPTLNPLYRDLLAHYGTVALPCRVRDPDRKGKVEAGVGHAPENTTQRPTLLRVWKKHKLTSIVGRRAGPTPAFTAPPNDRWLAMFAEEKPHLLPLPLEPFPLYQYGQRVVHLDGCVEVEAAYYSAPPGWIGRRLQGNGMD